MKVLKMEVGMLGTNCYIAVNEATGHGVVVDPGGDGDRIVAAIQKEGACSSVCDRIWSSSGSPARRRRAFKPVLRGGSCATSNSGRCSNGGSSSAAHGRDVCTYSGPEVTANGVVRG